MTELVIGRLSATVPAAPDDRDRCPRVQRLLGRVAEHRLDDALGAVTLPSGEWCVRRVELALPLDLDRPDLAIEAQWAKALVDAVRAALATGSPDVVHFHRVSEALADLVASVALGQIERVWAWTQLGLLRPGDPPLGPAAADAVLAAMRRHPESALVAVAAAVRVAGVAALHRLFGARGWSALAALVVAELCTASVDVRFGLSTGPVAAFPSEHDGAVDPPDPQLAGLAATLLGRSTLAAEFRRSRIRPDTGTAQAWAVLVAAHADPAVLSRSTAPAVVAELAAKLHTPGSIRPVGPRAGTRAVPAHELGARGHDLGSPAPERGTPGAELAAPAAQDGDPPVTDLETRAADRGQRWPTPWAGLLFLLSTAAEAGVPDELLADPALGDRPLWWVLHAVLTRLVPAAPDDPAVLTLAGLLPGEDPDPQAPSEGQAAQLAWHAQRWAAATAARLDRAAEDPLEVVTEVALRRGEVLAEPGWIEVHLPLGEVDIDVRRAGLDVDPGWVPWLGAVVRFVYE